MVKKPEKMAEHRSTRHTALVRFFFALNVFLLCAVFIQAAILIAQLDTFETSPACEGSPDALETGKQEMTSQTARGRYCYAERPVRCKEQGKEVENRGNRSLCCGNLGERLYTVMAKDVRTRLQLDAGKGTRLDRVKRYIRQLQNDSSTGALRVAAHVGISTENVTYSGENLPRIHWAKDGERSFVSGGLIHGGDRVIVSTAGYYYVYCGLQFDVDPTATKNTALVAFMYRHVNGTRESQRKLIMTRESTCRTTRRGRRGPVSMYMAGIFLLRQDDEVSVLSYSHDMLTKSPATTYLGVHLV